MNKNIYSVLDISSDDNNDVNNDDNNDDVKSIGDISISDDQDDQDDQADQADHDDQNDYNNKNKSYQNKKNKQYKNNFKKMLCHNYVFTKSCHYKYTCSYAHTLEEQCIDPDRKYIFNLIDDNCNWSAINISTNKSIYNILLSLTHLCNKCLNCSCTGGYNCKFGLCNNKYLICLDDLNYGICNKNGCSKIHLTKRGLIPYYKNINDTLNNTYIKFKINENIYHLLNINDNNLFKFDIKNHSNINDNILKDGDDDSDYNNDKDDKDIKNNILDDYISDCDKSIFD
jgi:hypothetical protein